MNDSHDSGLSDEACANGVQVDIGRVSPPVWAETIGTFRDATVYQAGAYAETLWGSRQLTHVIVRRSNCVVAAAQVRVVRVPLIPAGIAYVGWGPLWRRVGSHDDHADFDLAVAALHKEFVRNRGLLLRVVPNVEESEAAFGPLCDSLRRLGFQRAVDIPAYRTFRIGLASPLSTLRVNLDHKWRNQLNRAERNGLDVVEGESPELYRTFLTLYDEMLARKRFATVVNARDFGRMQALLPPHQKLRILVCRKDGRPVSGLVASRIGRTGIYLLGATNDEGMQHKGSYLLQWRLMQWLKEQGADVYDLGGIEPDENPGVYHFKKGLAGLDTRLVGTFEAVSSRATGSTVRSCEALAQVILRHRRRV